MASTKRAQKFDFRELTVWGIKLPEVTFAILPPSNNRPNPLATQETLYASVFAPGAICALERERGKLIWRRALPKYSSASVLLHEQRLLAHTPTTLFALNPESGETLWLFRPYGDEGESIYSCPSASEKRVYIGDRRGYLHCLDADSGKTIWKNLTNRAGGDVNSTPLLVHDLVIVSTNARSVLAYEAVSGKLAWEQELDGASTFGPVLHNRSVLVISDSLYALNPKSGRIRRRLFWSDRKVQQAVSTPQSIIVILGPNLPRTDISATNAEAMTAAAGELASKKTMRVVAQSGAETKRQMAVFCPEFRYEKATRLVYLSHLGGVDILHPATGKTVCHLTASCDTGNGIGLVSVRDGNIYVLTGDGTLYALRHPAQFQAVSH